jgi:hypothetical protein
MMFSKLFFALVAAVVAIESPAAKKTAGAMHKKKKNSDDQHLAREIDSEGNTLAVDEEIEPKNDHLRQDDSSSYVEKVDKKAGGKKHKKHHKASDEDKPENPKIQPVFVEEKAHKQDGNDTDAAADEKAAAYGLPVFGTFSLVAGAAVLL